MNEWLIYPLAGAASGLIGGLFGVGGGLIVVPVLSSLFALQLLAPDHTMQLALGTSLATIIATGASSTRAHHRRGGVRWDMVLRLAPAMVVGTWLGAAAADQLRSETLRYGFGLAELALGLVMWRGSLGAGPAAAAPGKAGMLGAGLVIGSASSLAGIGGGTLTVPFLVRCRLVMSQAVGSSAACGLPIAVSGTLSYIAWGWDETGLPELATGYVYWPAALGIMAASIFFAPLGARLAHSLPERLLKRGFALLLILLGLKMLLLP